MEPNCKLYQKIANHFKTEITQGIYQVGDMLPAERLIAEQMEVSRTVIREAMIMLEVEGYVEVRKGSGIRVINRQILPTPPLTESVTSFPDASFMLTCGPFELLQARQLFESNIAEFAATQATKQDLVALMKIQEQAKLDDYSRDSYWDSEFHIQLARCTQNSVVVYVAETLCKHRENNPYWQKLHEHIEDNQIRSWCSEHDEIVKALVQRDPQAARQATWQHLENTKQMLFDGSNDDYDRFLFSESPITTF
ncbi:GntR family transcriptional regulator [Vibrio mangrovi]|uniref:GntR family transcriptional regulator n=1 Tax=Vibrio mangrovi TaxID=474394 RepID=A0A1Y6IYW3_9VIBR|nr:GntR family transcriptional regulator [Vibrio mangrovi]MDW6002680.1 GntR family transcriptional regulator [Vibrio mangrovi]SMS02839.1 Putative L-lactate dehydrogenase operon regulatory protein [Vibrio mangrovi]